LQKDRRVIIPYSHVSLVFLNMLVCAIIPAGKIRLPAQNLLGNFPDKEVPKTDFLTVVAEAAA
jgi:hypothetical protein